MNTAIATACALLSITCASVLSSPTPGGFTVRSGDTVLRVQAPLPSDAFDYLERTLADMDFFRANNYQVSLPDHPLLSEAARSATDREERRSVFVEEVYRA
ncbi:MAG: hypothetical protein AAF809_05790, partial [Bacteroidota bacterium]